MQIFTDVEGFLEAYWFGHDIIPWLFIIIAVYTCITLDISLRKVSVLVLPVKKIFFFLWDFLITLKYLEMCCLVSKCLEIFLLAFCCWFLGWLNCD